VLTVQNALERDGGVTRLKPPKTESSRRTIMLPRFVVDRLRRHRVEQAQRFPADVTILQTPETLVFGRNGEPWVPNTFTTAFMRALGNVGVKHTRLHDLRHTFASLMLEKWRRSQDRLDGAWALVRGDNRQRLRARQALPEA
jgi:integrase